MSDAWRGSAKLRQGRREQLRVTGNVRLVASEADEGGTRIIEARRISKSYDERSIVRDFSIRIVRGDRVGLVGANGAGKTTLINMLTGRLDAGCRHRENGCHRPHGHAGSEPRRA